MKWPAVRWANLRMVWEYEISLEGSRWSLNPIQGWERVPPSSSLPILSNRPILIQRIWPTTTFVQNRTRGGGRAHFHRHPPFRTPYAEAQPWVLAPCGWEKSISLDLPYMERKKWTHPWAIFPPTSRLIKLLLPSSFKLVLGKEQGCGRAHLGMTESDFRCSGIHGEIYPFSFFFHLPTFSYYPFFF